MAKASKTLKLVITTIILTFIVLAIFTALFINFIIPAYEVTREQIYGVLSKAFPVLVGFVLIEIAILVGKRDGDDYKDTIDKLSPNSYDSVLYTPAVDDPMARGNVTATDKADGPIIVKEIEKVVTKEVEVPIEVVKEVPVEIVKEVEVIKEVEVVRETPSEPTVIIREVEVPVEVKVPVEVIREVEVPVDVIKEIRIPGETVEVIKEIPVEVIKEVQVEIVKEVEVPVEVIKETEVIKEVEVPVEVKVPFEVIKEVEVPVEVIKVNEIIKEVEVPVEVIKEVGTPEVVYTPSEALDSEISDAIEGGYNLSIVGFKNNDRETILKSLGEETYLFEKDDIIFALLPFFSRPDAEKAARLLKPRKTASLNGRKITAEALIKEASKGL